MPNLRNQFEKALTNIEINGQKRKRAIDAHTEIWEPVRGRAASTSRQVWGTVRPVCFF